MADPFDTPDQGDEIRFDRYKRYLLPHPETGKLVPWTRTTTFAKAIMDDYLLAKWQQRMVAKGLAFRPDLYALAASASIEDRDTLNKVAEDAMEAAGSKSRANLGTALHTFTEVNDTITESEADAMIPDHLRPDLEAYRALVRDAGFRYTLIEQRVIVPELQEATAAGVAGTLDRLGHRDKPDRTGVVDSRPVIIDLKTGRDLEWSWHEISVQLAIYANASMMWLGPPYPGVYAPMPADIRKDIAYVIHLPVGEARASLYEVDIAAGWEDAQLCMQVRRVRKRKGLAQPVSLGERVDHSGHTVIDGETVDVHERIKLARSRTDLSKVWLDARAAGIWTSELEQLGKARLREIEAA